MSYQPNRIPYARECSECCSEIPARDIAYTDDVVLLAYGVVDTLCEKCYVDYNNRPLSKVHQEVRIQSARHALKQRSDRREHARRNARR